MVTRFSAACSNTVNLPRFKDAARVGTAEVEPGPLHGVLRLGQVGLKLLRQPFVFALNCFLMLFKAYVHPDCIIFNRTRLELASGGELPYLFFCVRSFEEHVLKGPFR
jgi:hypothetical protein